MLDTLQTMTQSSYQPFSHSVIQSEIEPLDRLARFSWDWAPLLCDPEHGCCDYHRSWSSVRLLQQGGSLPAGMEFFQRELSSLIELNRKRVLISGAADTGLMTLVCRIFKEFDAVPEVVLIDRCLTTVTQNRLMASYLGLEADIRQGDIRTINCDPVDAVIAHSFLGFFPEPARQQVINAWGRVLSPGGKVLMSTMLAQNKNVPYPPRDEPRIRASKIQLIESAMKTGMARGKAERLGEVAAEMLKRRVSHDPQLTTEFLTQAFSQAGINSTDVTLKNKKFLGPLAAFRLPSDLIQRGEVVGVRT